ncbi:hypothetical protein QFC20_007208 [Naganishia adeliensis]|uniref:Uncharacterized protein n=1 Tax=Naganishia adeliensis TaxID=92952 RepID=A0ACC2V190_9TREE|nr:hypothetical protein QFC20_007208 [Naganishia adeliensis]
MNVVDTLLPHLREHLPMLFKSTVLFFAIQSASYALSPALFPKTMQGMTRKERIEWSSKTVALVHALLIIPLAFKTYDDPELRQDPIFGYSPRVGNVLAFTCGHFIWDTIDSLFNASAGFVVHAVACLAVFGFSFGKFGVDKKFPTLSLVNDLLFVVAFFFARIIGGSRDSFVFFREMITRWDQIPTFLFLVYGVGNLALNGLNWLWFSKIIKRTIRTLKGGKTRAANGQEINGKAVNGNARQ